MRPTTGENRMNTNEMILDQNDIRIELPAFPLNENVSKEYFEKIPLSTLAIYGVEFAEPLKNMVSIVRGGGGSGMYMVNTNGGTLSKFADGRGYFGGVRGAKGQFESQAVLNPVVFNPTTLFMAAALHSLDDRLGRIEELQQEMMDFLVQKEKAEVRGNLVFLADIMQNYRFNWNNELFRNSNHVKVLDIRQAAEQKIIFYREQIESKRKKKSFIHSDAVVKKQTEELQELFNEYQLSLYMHAFASYLEVMLLGNFAKEYLEGVRTKILEYSSQYKDLYLECQEQMAEYSDKSVQSSVLRGLRSAGNAMGKAASKVPLVKKTSAEETLTGVGTRLGQIGEIRKEEQLSKWNKDDVECVEPFVESIASVDRFYNNPVRIAFDAETLYLGTE